MQINHCLVRKIGSIAKRHHLLGPIQCGTHSQTSGTNGSMLSPDQLGMASQWGGPSAIAGSILRELAHQFGPHTWLQSDRFGPFEAQCHLLKVPLLLRWIGCRWSQIPWPGIGKAHHEIRRGLRTRISANSYDLFVHNRSGGVLRKARLRSLRTR